LFCPDDRNGDGLNSSLDCREEEDGEGASATTSSRSIPGGKVDRTRRDAISLVVAKSFLSPAVMAAALTISPHQPAGAANLPSPAATKVDASKIGTVETLLPLVELRDSMKDIESQIAAAASGSGGGKSEASLLVERVNDIIVSSRDRLPAAEGDFKSLFDRYSDAVSYKQKFVDSNAFLVYYTRGFDGPGRPSIESDLPTRQPLQYGYRNDAWVGWDSFLSELEYRRHESNGGGGGGGGSFEDEVGDLLSPLRQSLRAVEGYLDLVPRQDLAEAEASAAAVAR